MTAFRINNIEKAKRLRTVDDEFGIGRNIDPQVEIAALRKLNTDLELRLMHLQDDFNNYKRNKKKEIDQLKQTAAEDVIKDLGDVIDAIWSGYTISPDAHGLSLLYTKICKVIEKNGGRVLDTKYEKFNPDIHEAVGKTDDVDWFDNIFVGDGGIADVVRPGIMVGDKLIRPEQVIVRK